MPFATSWHHVPRCAMPRQPSRVSRTGAGTNGTIMTDFVVIGAGVYGAATAWWLARGGARVHVIDERGVASRASGGPGRRGVRANGRDVRELALMGHAYAIWPGLHDELGVAQFHERTGHLLLAETAIDVERARAQAWLQCQHGIRSELLDADAARAREPGLGRDVRAAVFCPEDGVADHDATTRAYAAAAERLGVAMTLGARVRGIEIRGDRAVGVTTTSGERIAAASGVLVLANSAVGDLLRPWQTLPVWNQCLQVLISAPLERVPFRHLTGHLSRTISLKTEGDDRVMVSGGWLARWDDETQQGTPVLESVDGNLAEAVAVYPALAGMRVEAVEVGHQESNCIDGIPIIDSVPQVRNLWYATGWCGHGWAIAPVVSQLLARWALEDERPLLLAPFSHARFSAQSADR